jgi:hypothetical protein
MVLSSTNHATVSLSVDLDFYLIKVPLDTVPGTVSTSWINTIDHTLFAMNKARAYSVIFDHNTSPTGFYVLGGYDYTDKNTNDKAFFMSHI